MGSSDHSRKRPHSPGAPGRAPLSRVRGLTLIEILVVLVLMLTIISIAYPILAPGTSDRELKSVARQLASGARVARSLAVAERREAFLRIDTEKNSFSVDDQKEHVLPEDIAILLEIATSDAMGDSVGAIRFFPDGGSNGGRVTLSVGEDRGHYEVDVDWLTGRVTILAPE